jgi:hypothetical protein
VGISGRKAASATDPATLYLLQVGVGTALGLAIGLGV